MLQVGKVVTVLGMALVLCGLAASSVQPSDIPPELKDKLQAVVTNVASGLKQGLYRFVSTPIQLGPGERTYLTSAQFTPVEALKQWEIGYPSERYENDQSIQIWNKTFPAGRYYLIMWIADRGFERFGIKFLARTPLVLFVKDQSFELMDFALPCKANIPVPNPNPNQVFPYTRTSDDCPQGSAATTATDSTATLPKNQAQFQSDAVLLSDVNHWGLDAWNIGKVVVTVAEAKLKNASVEIPTKEQLFPNVKEKQPPG